MLKLLGGVGIYNSIYILRDTKYFIYMFQKVWNV